MHLSEYMEQNALDDHAVADAIGVNRVSISRYRRRIERPSWKTVEAIHAFTGGVVTANDWMEAAAPSQIEAAKC